MRLWSSSELTELASPLVERLPQEALLAIAIQDGPLLHSTVLACHRLSRSVLIIPTEDRRIDTQEIAREYGATHLISDLGGELQIAPLGAEARDATQRVGLFTSGTTGQPKLAWHTWKTISSPAERVPERLNGASWLLTYTPRSYAGLQVLFACARGSGRLGYATLDRKSLPSDIHKAGISAISATPSWWRMLCLAWPPSLSAPVLEQATLGGELVTQADLDMVDRLFRPSVLSHIYASTEAGSAITVSDRKAGFPIDLLHRDGPVQVRVRDGQLELRSDFAMRAYAGTEPLVTWYRTPDLAVIRSDRVYLTGRADNVVIVGGVKVLPEAVEVTVRQHPNILDCVAYPIRSPITGELLGMDVVAKSSDLSISELKEWLRRRLAREWVPVRIRLVDHLPISASGKRVRSVL